MILPRSKSWTNQKRQDCRDEYGKMKQKNQRLFILILNKSTIFNDANWPSQNLECDPIQLNDVLNTYNILTSANLT